MGNLLGEDRLLASLSPEQRRASYDLLHDIPDEVKSVIEREGIDCDYRKGGALYCAARYPEQEATLRQYLDKLYSQGLNENDYRWLSPRTDGAADSPGQALWRLFMRHMSRPSIRPSWSEDWRARSSAWA